MMLPEQVDIEILQRLAGKRLYYHWMAGESASVRRQTKVAEEIRRDLQEEAHVYPPWVRSFLEEGNHGELIALLEASYRRLQDLLEEQKAHRAQIMAGWDAKTVEAMETVLTQFPYVDLQVQGDCLVFPITVDPLCLTSELWLHQVAGDLAWVKGTTIEEAWLEATETGYALRLQAVEWEEEFSGQRVVQFHHAEVKDRVCWQEPFEYGSTPWELLGLAADSLCAKADYDLALCNEQEKELLGLLQEISYLFGEGDDREKPASGNAALRAVMEQQGAASLVPALDRLSELSRQDAKFAWRLLQLRNRLNGQEFEPLFRFIYGKIMQSQKEYPPKVSLFYNQKILQQTRQTITQQLKAAGFAGEYPNFVKEGPLKGIHLADSYDTQYFVGMEKWGVYRVYCVEGCNGSDLEITFACGTALLKKGEQAEDIYACLFNAKGRRLMKTVRYWLSPGEDDPACDLSLCVSAAAKRAQVKRLNKQERKECVQSSAGLGTFMGILIFMGGLFGAFMTLGFMLMAVVIAVALGEAGTIPSLLTDIPWWWILVFCWVAFGGTMGLLTVITKNR